MISALKMPRRVAIRLGFSMMPLTTRSAASSGVSVGTLYQYYPSKEAIIGALLEAIVQAMAEAPKNVESYRGGNTKIIGAFVGAVMKKLGGKGNPKRINELLTEKLKA